MVTHDAREFKTVNARFNHQDTNSTKELTKSYFSFVCFVDESKKVLK